MIFCDIISNKISGGNEFFTGKKGHVNDMVILLFNTISTFNRFLYVFGGTNGFNYFNDLYKYDII